MPQGISGCVESTAIEDTTNLDLLVICLMKAKKTASAETTATVAYRKHIKRGSSSLVLVSHHIQQQEH